MPIKDPEKRRAYYRAYTNRRRQEEPEFRDRQYARNRINKDKYMNEVFDVLVEFKSGGCVLCGESEFVCLDAHHVDPVEKSFGISEGVSGGKSVAAIKSELEKCVCLCKNCHARVHAGISTIVS